MLVERIDSDLVVCFHNIALLTSANVWSKLEPATANTENLYVATSCQLEFPSAYQRKVEKAAKVLQFLLMIPISPGFISSVVNY